MGDLGWWTTHLPLVDNIRDHNLCKRRILFQPKNHGPPNGPVVEGAPTLSRRVLGSQKPFSFEAPLVGGYSAQPQPSEFSTRTKCFPPSPAWTSTGWKIVLMHTWHMMELAWSFMATRFATRDGSPTPAKVLWIQEICTQLWHNYEIIAGKKKKHSEYMLYLFQQETSSTANS